MWEKFWNQAEWQLSSLQARWCLHALRIHSHALFYQALLGSPWLHRQQEPQVQGSTSYWKVMSHPTYSAGSHARLLWTDVCSCQTWAQLPTAALHSKSLLIAYTQPQGSYWNFSQYFQYLWTGPHTGFMHMLKHEFTFSEVSLKNSWLLSSRLYTSASEKILRQNRDIF